MIDLLLQSTLVRAYLHFFRVCDIIIMIRVFRKMER